MPIRRFVHEDVITTTIAYIATTPMPVATGRYSARSGTSRSGSPNGMKLSISRPPRCTPRSASPTVATNWWKRIEVGFATCFVTSEVVDTSPQATERNSIR